MGLAWSKRKDRSPNVHALIHRATALSLWVASLIVWQARLLSFVPWQSHSPQSLTFMRAWSFGLPSVREQMQC